MNEYFIAYVDLGRDVVHWSGGSTEDEAVSRCRFRVPLRYRKHYTPKVIKFTSDKPFAPFGHAAADGEAAAYLDDIGDVVLQHCERIDL